MNVRKTSSLCIKDHNFMGRYHMPVKGFNFIPTCRAIVQGWLYILCLSRCGIPVVVAYSKIPTTSTSKCLELGESTIAKYFILTKVCRCWGTLNLHVLFRKGFLYHWATAENNCSWIQWIEHYISKNPRVLYIDKPGKFLF